MKLHILIFLQFSLMLFNNGVEGQLTYARVDSLTDALKYLVQFGYLKDLKEVASLLNPSFSSFDPFHPATSAMRIALTKFQEYAKLPVTGEFDTATKKKMNTPRCGNKDILQINSVLDINQLLRKRRYVAGSFVWEKRELTYKVSKFSATPFSKEITIREVDRAFELWGNVTNLFFIRRDSASSVDIELKFARLAHGDIEPFDGRGITLAHAFPPGPEIGGDIHFDDDEEWTSGEYKGTNFLHVVVHELGHALGLRHSDVEEAIMYAFARPYEPNLQLDMDDVLGIQSMYGEKSENEGTTSSTTSTQSPTEFTTENSDETRTEEDPNVNPDLCKNSKIDAITTLADGSVYVFRGNYAFQIDPKGQGIKNSDQISYIFFGVPSGPVDAALTYENQTFIFKGDQSWRYTNRKLDPTYPKSISDDFPGIPNDLDAAFVWPGDNQMYFFKGDKYWSFNPQENPPVGRNYPLPISQWYGLPTKDLDAVFTTSPTGPTYFFKDDNYWLFDDENFQVAETDPPYPMSSRVMWFACTEYRPDAGELKRGFIRKAVNKVKSVVKGVVGHFDNKVKKLTSWLPIG